MSSLQWQILIFGLIAIFFKYLIGVVLVTYYKLKDKSVHNNNVNTRKKRNNYGFIFQQKEQQYK